MLQAVIQRLADIGYEVSDGDKTALTFLIGKTDDYIRNYCNVSEVPKQVRRSEADAVAAEFIAAKAMSGGLDDSAINVSSVSQVSEGDTSVSYSNDGTGSFNAFYAEAKRRLDTDMLPFRRMRW